MKKICCESEKKGPCGIKKACLQDVFALSSRARNAGHVLKIILACMAVLIITENKAYAYTDPGTGTLIWQGLLAAFFGAIFYIKKIINLFKRKKNGQ